MFFLSRSDSGARGTPARLGGQSERAHGDIGRWWKGRTQVRTVQLGIHRRSSPGGLRDKRRDRNRVENGNNQTKASILYQFI